MLEKGGVWSWNRIIKHKKIEIEIFWHFNPNHKPPKFSKQAKKPFFCFVKTGKWCWLILMNKFLSNSNRIGIDSSSSRKKDDLQTRYEISPCKINLINWICMFSYFFFLKWKIKIFLTKLNLLLSLFILIFDRSALIALEWQPQIYIFALLLSSVFR